MDWKNTINKNNCNTLIPGCNKKVTHTWKQTCSFKYVWRFCYHQALKHFKKHFKSIAHGTWSKNGNKRYLKIDTKIICEKIDVEILLQL